MGGGGVPLGVYYRRQCGAWLPLEDSNLVPPEALVGELSNEWDTKSGISQPWSSRSLA